MGLLNLSVAVMAIVTIATITTTQAGDMFCQDKDNGYFSNPSDCHSFYQCFSKRTYKHTCPGSLTFNPTSRSCGRSACKTSESESSSGSETNAETSAPRPAATAAATTKSSSSSSSSSSSGSGSSMGSCKRIVCYFTSWAQYRPKGAKQYPKDVDGNLCTHIIHSFATIKSHKLSDLDYSDPKLLKGLVDLKKVNPSLKVLVAVGGWTQSSKGFSPMVATSSTRNIFINSAVDYLRKYKLDGLDLDWEYPANRGGPAGDKDKFSELLRELRTRFDREGLLLTAAVGAPEKIAHLAYDIPVLNDKLDFINLMSYDFYGSWDSTVVHHSALEGSQQYTVKSIVDYWIRSGASKDKLVIGVPLYGRTATVSNGNRIVGAGTKGEYTKTNDFLSYYEVCLAKKNGGMSQQHMDPKKGPNFVQGNQWIGFDDADTMVEKTNFAKNYGGIMMWDISLDDFTGKFCNEGRYPLMNKIMKTCMA